VPLLSPPRRRWAAALALVLALTVLLGWGAPRLESAARHLSGRDGAEWIWAPVGKKEQSPVAFYLVRDFDLGTPPERARLLVAADEEYVLTLNARRIGAGVWRPGHVRQRGGLGTELDVYEVAPLLRPGGNRLLAEVRSGRAAGGLLLRLVDGAGRPLVLSDRSWRLVRAEAPGLARGWLPVTPPGASEPAFSWGPPPAGRWGMPQEGPARPLLPDLAAPALRPVRAERLERPEKPLPAGAAPEQLAPQALFDWGREVTGRLVLELAPDERRRAGLLFPGSSGDEGGPEPPGIWSSPRSEEGAPVLVPPGAREWLDPRPRRLRFARVLGLAGVVGARIEPVAEKEPSIATGQGAPARGVLGLEPPPLRTPVEDEVWRELERVPGLALREEL
jgi:hypothetical protein